MQVLARPRGGVLSSEGRVTRRSATPLRRGAVSWRLAASLRAGRVADMGYHQLTYRERYLIARYKSRGDSIREIGRLLFRDPGTISRELKRNADSSDGRYRVDKAHSYAKARR